MSSVKCAHYAHEVANTVTMLNTVLCLDCGRETDMFGRPRPPKPQFTAPSFQERKARGEVQ